MNQQHHDMRQMTGQGRKIEEGSFAVVDAEAGEHGFPPDQWQVVRRVIHATADFEFVKLMKFHPQAMQAGVAALKSGCKVIVDVQMIQVGLNKDRLNAYGCSIHHYISDEDVIAAAKAADSTRAIEAMRKAARLGELKGAVVAVGNAPTALLEVLELAKDPAHRPALIIGVPVGFVSAAESKAAVQAQDEIPYIVSQGRKGGSPIAVAIIHALLLWSVDGEKTG